MYLRAVHYGIDTLSADLEAYRSLYSAICEIEITELILSFISVNEHSQCHILQLIAAEHLPELAERLAPMYMPLACHLGFPPCHLGFSPCHLERSRDILIPPRHNSRQRRKQRPHRMSHLLSPRISITGRSCLRI